MIGIQLISILFILFMLYVVRIHHKKGELPQTEFLFWIIIFIVLGAIVLLPNTARFITRTFAVGRLMDLITIIAFMIVFFMLIDNRIQIHKLRKKLEDQVRKKAMGK